MFGWFDKKEKARQIHDDNLKCRANKALLDNELNNYSQCRRFIDSGHGHEADGNLKEALICYETSLRLRDTPMARYDIAGILIRMGRPHEALDELRKAQAMKCPDDLAEMIEKRIALLS